MKDFIKVAYVSSFSPHLFSHFYRPYPSLSYPLIPLTRFHTLITNTLYDQKRENNLTHIPCCFSQIDTRPQRTPDAERTPLTSLDRQRDGEGRQYGFLDQTSVGLAETSEEKRGYVCSSFLFLSPHLSPFSFLIFCLIGFLTLRHCHHLSNLDDHSMSL